LQFSDSFGTGAWTAGGSKPDSSIVGATGKDIDESYDIGKPGRNKVSPELQPMS
jgi:hypothetical protein